MAKKRQKWNESKSGRLVRKAAHIMADNGVARGSLLAQDKRMCILGAIQYAWCGNANTQIGYVADGYASVPRDLEERYSSLLARNPEITQTVQDLRRYLGISIPVFNDNLNTPDEDIIKTLHKFADEFDPKKV